MIHPHTTVRLVSERIGLGVIATQAIPRGTLVVVPDPFDRLISRDEFRALPEPLRSQIETYLYHDREGRLHLSWDHAKYMNHSCEANTMLTAYGIEIVVADIPAGDELTTEYGLLNVQESYALGCGCRGCRRELRLDDIDRHGAAWDTRIRAALQCAADIPQPLASLVEPSLWDAIVALRAPEAPYRSVMELKWRPSIAAMPSIAAKPHRESSLVPLPISMAHHRPAPQPSWHRPSLAAWLLAE